MRNTWTFVAALAVALLPSIAHASPISAGFPPPGATGAIFSGTGSNLADATGKTRIYNFASADTTQWSELYFDITGGQIVTNADSMTFDTRWPADGGSNWSMQQVIGNTETDSLAPVQFFDAATSSNVTVNPTLVMQFFQLDGTTPLPITNFMVTALGDAMPAIVLKFSPTELAGWGNGFQVRQKYEAFSGTPLANFLNANNGGAGLSTSTSAGFWYDPPTAAAVPEPASLVLLGSGCLAIIRRRRHSRA
jgi:hypothetical protein